MSDLANTLATETDISGEQAHKGLGALLSFLKERLGEENFQPGPALLAEVTARIFARSPVGPASACPTGLLLLSARRLPGPS